MLLTNTTYIFYLYISSIYLFVIYFAHQHNVLLNVCCRGFMSITGCKKMRDKIHFEFSNIMMDFSGKI